MAKYEFTDVEDFIRFAKAGGAPVVGVSINSRLEDVMDKEGKPAKKMFTFLLLTSTGAMNGHDDQYVLQLVAAEEIVATDEDVAGVNKKAEKEKNKIYETLQEGGFATFSGRVFL